MAVVLAQLMTTLPREFGDKPDKYGWSPLHILANNRDENGVRPGMIRTLCNARANLEAKKGKGQTPLMTACNTAHLTAAAELMLQGADPYSCNDEGTTLFDMSWHNREVRNWVIQLGVGRGQGVSGTGRFTSNSKEFRRQASQQSDSATSHPAMLFGDKAVNKVFGNKPLFR